MNGDGDGQEPYMPLFGDEESMEPFGFTVERSTWVEQDTGHKRGKGWTVYISADDTECPDWPIVRNLSHARALAVLDRFIAEAQAARAALAARTEYPPS